jgi:hypothetical protein
VPVVRRDRAALLLTVSLLVACAHGPGVPPWLVLRVGAQARLAASNPLEPERATVYPSADAAHAALRGPAFRHAAAGDLVTVTQIDGVVDGTHAVAVSDARGPLGWVIAEANLRPAPPAGTQLIVAATAADGSAQELFSDQDDDEGQAFGATTHVTYEGFASDPGNAEYHVHVDDGPLAGYDGYVVESELQTPQTHAFRLVGDGT